MTKITDYSQINITKLPADAPVVHSLDSSKGINKKTKIVSLVIILLGVFSGYILSRTSPGMSVLQGEESLQDTAGKTQTADSKTYPDKAEGTLEAGGMNGEGTHKLIRPGGDNQTVYLTSSVMDLSPYVGKKVRVWGQTFAAKKAGWLMDVGKVEVL